MAGEVYFRDTDKGGGFKSKAVKGAGTMLFTRVLVSVIHIGSIIVMARLLTPEDFGLVAMVTAFSFFLFNVGLNGFTEAIIQKEGLTHSQASCIFWIGVGTSALLAVLFSLSGPLFNWFYGESRLIPIIIVFSTGFVFSGLATQHRALINRNFEFVKVMIMDVSAVILSVVVGVSMALSGFSYWAIVGRQMTIPAVTAVGAWLLCSWRPSLPRWDPEIKPMIRFAAHTFGSFSMRYFSRNLDKILIGWYWGSKLLGNYDRAYHLFIMPVNQLQSPLTNVALATLSRLKSDPAQYRRYYLKALTLITFIGMGVSLNLTLAGRDIIRFLLGPQWEETGFIFSALGPAIGITLISGTYSWLLLSSGHAEKLFKWTTFSMILTLLCLAVGLPFGVVEVALAYSFSFYLLFIPGIWYSGRPMGISVGETISQIWRYFAAALLSGAATGWILYGIPQTVNFLGEMPILVKIIFLCSICSLLYLVFVAFFYGSINPLAEIVSLARDMFLKKAKKS